MSEKPNFGKVSACAAREIKRKAAFTLAEVLVTLGVIGVVAALTMPSLITKHQKMVFATKAKQTYSILSNALITSVAENGPMSEWNYGESSNAVNSGSQKDLTYIVNTYFKPYFKVAEDIGYKNGNYSLLLSNGMTLSFLTDGGINEAGIYTPTAIYIIVSDNKNIAHYNGASRDYSRHDLFFKVNKATKNTVYPFAWGNNGTVTYSNIKRRDELINNQDYGCSKTKNKNKRYNCAALMMWDNWQIKDDYPW